MSDTEPETDDKVALTSAIVAAYVGNNQISAEEIPALVQTVHASLLGLADAHIDDNKPRRAPAVPIEDSITEHYLICLEDGKKLKMLKRYLRTHFDMSAEDYIEKWDLPHDYPMVAPSYAEKRSELAKKSGLGQNSIEADEAAN